jgi:hypothetical protein
MPRIDTNAAGNDRLQLTGNQGYLSEAHGLGVG